MLRLTTPPVFDNDEKTRRAGVLHIILWVLAGAVVVLMGVASLTSPAPGPALALGLGTEALTFGLLWLNRRGQVRRASFLLALGLWVIVTISVWTLGGPYTSPTLSAYLIVIVIAGLLLGGRAALGLAGLCALAVLGLLVADDRGLIPPFADPNHVVADWAVYTVIFSLTALLLRLSSNSLRTALAQARRNEQVQREINRQLEELRASLEQRVNERTVELVRRTVQLETSGQVGQQVTSILDTDELLELVVNLIQVRFNYYFVGVWLVTERQDEVALQAGMGRRGFNLPEALSRLPLETSNIVAHVCRTGQMRVVDDVTIAPDYLADTTLPDCRSELALPLRMGETTLGALDIKSDQLAAFTAEDYIALQALADQLAVAIRNARLYQAEQHRRHLAEALERAGRALASDLDIRHVPGRILAELATVVPHAQGAILLRRESTVRVVAQSGFADDQSLPTQPLPIREGDVFYQMMLARRPLLSNDLSSPVDWWPAPETELAWLGLPLIAQERVIGMIVLTRLAGAVFTLQDMTLASAFSGQAAIALENANLYQEILQFNTRLEKLVQQRTEELHSAYHALERLDKTKSDFINVTAHELRTPLTLVKGYAQILAETLGKKDAEVRPMINGILTGEERLHEIVNRMLDMTKLDTHTLVLRLQLTKLATIVEHVHREFASALRERQLSLTMTGLHDLPLIQADPDLLTKVFHNLIINAIKYTPDGGSILVSGQALGEEAVEVVVSDTGIGIDTDHHELIFEKFYQAGQVAVHSSGKTKFKGGGPGLGLAIARGIVLAHGGKIWVESVGYDEQNCPGSHFHVHLPLKALPRPTPRNGQN
jgi:signal transduction histidine kinase/putative methionine-R-sulfoxide reductase with GAF domain